MALSLRSPVYDLVLLNTFTIVVPACAGKTNFAQIYLGVKYFDWSGIKPSN